MAGNKNSGSRDNEYIAKKVLRQQLPKSVRKIIQLRDDPHTSKPLQFECSRYIVDHGLGKPTTKVELPGDGVLMLRWVESAAMPDDVHTLPSSAIRELPEATSADVHKSQA